MSKLLVDLFMLHTKALVNTYTWTTLPFYALTQRPWRKLKMSKSFGVKITKDSYGRVVYSRPSPKPFSHPYTSRPTLNEIVPLLDLNRKAVGVRQVISEQMQFDESGKPVTIEGKPWKKIKLADEYTWLTAGQVMQRVDSLARGLRQLGVKKGEKVLIYADNSLEWLCTSLALQRINAITVTLPSILSNEGVLYGINQSEARFVVTSQELLPRISAISAQFEQLSRIIYITSKLAAADDQQSVIAALKEQFAVSTFEQILTLGHSQVSAPDFAPPHPDDITLIMYTSGTTGNPKGVMMTHRNLSHTLLNLMRIEEETKIPLFDDTNYAAYLPMAHLLGYVLNFGSFVSNSRLALCSASTIFDSSPVHVFGQVGDFSLIKPQFIGMVPLMISRLQKDIYSKLSQQSALAAPLFTYLMNYKIKWTSRGFDTPIINKLYQQINSQYGGKVAVMLVSSSPLHPNTQALVQAALNIKLLQYYGATEVTAGSHIMLPEDLSFGAVGVPLHSFKYYLKDWPEGDYFTTDPNPRGEIVLGGPTVANGYFKMPQETAESFKVDPDGTRWFETGDIGEVLPNGTLKLIDRKKDLTKLANGEFVSLGKIESGLRNSPLVENICVCTEPYSNFVTALISPNRKVLVELAQKLTKQNVPFEELCRDAEVMEHVMNSLRSNGNELGLLNKEMPTRITLVTEEWTAENNLLTAALKLRRKQVSKLYERQIKEMFSS